MHTVPFSMASSHGTRLRCMDSMLAFSCWVIDLEIADIWDGFKIGACIALQGMMRCITLRMMQSLLNMNRPITSSAERLASRAARHPAEVNFHSCTSQCPMMELCLTKATYVAIRKHATPSLGSTNSLGAARKHTVRWRRHCKSNLSLFFNDQ